jgi:LmbE family N-acetylglucosaminyl deacetylase
LAEAPILVLSPHPDDAVLGCWSAVANQRRAEVVNIFAGIPPAGTSGGWDRECGVPNSAEMMRRRRAEDERALAIARVRPVHLEFLDMQYVDEVRDIEAIAAAVKLAVPRWSAVYAPAAIGGYTRLVGTQGMTLAPHPDHETVRDVALRLERQETPTHFYAEIPYGLADIPGRGWPEGIEDFTPVLEAATGRTLELSSYELSAAALTRRIEALAEYQTQLPRIELGVGRFARETEVLRYEAQWRRSADTDRGSPRRTRRR